MTTAEEFGRLRRALVDVVDACGEALRPLASRRAVVEILAQVLVMLACVAAIAGMLLAYMTWRG